MHQRWAESGLARFRRTQPALLGAQAALAGLLLAAWAALSPAGLSGGDWQGWIAATVPVAMAAMAQAFPIAAGGQGLAAGATTVAVAALVAQLPASLGAVAAIGIGLGGGLALGLCNGALIGFGGLRSTPVTLASGAAAMACALQFSGGAAPAQPGLAAALLGWRVAGVAVIPPLAVLGAAAAATLALASPAGCALRRLGAGAPQPGRAWALLGAYAAAGLGAGAGGVFLAASYGAANLALGAPVLVQVLAAVALGGGVPGLRGGSAAGALLGAVIVTATGNLFVPLEIPEFLSGALDGGWLLLGVAACRAAAGRPPALPQPARGHAARFPVRLAAGAFAPLLAFRWLPESGDLTTLLAGMALLAVGQVAALRAGMVDLAMPGLIAAASVGTVALAGGRDAALPGALALLAAAALAVGAWHGWAAARLGRAAMAVTLATAALAQSAAAYCLVELPTGFAPPRLAGLALGRWLGASPAAWLMAALALALAWALDGAARRWPGRRLAWPGALGSAAAAVVFGVMLAGLGGSVHFSQLDSYFLPTIAAALLASPRAGGGVARAIPFALGIGLLDTALVIGGAGYAGRIGAVCAALLLGEATQAGMPRRRGGELVGAAGFEPTTPSPPD